jgi:hypothetical protein
MTVMTDKWQRTETIESYGPPRKSDGPPHQIIWATNVENAGVEVYFDRGGGNDECWDWGTDGHLELPRGYKITAELSEAGSLSVKREKVRGR